MFRYTAVVFLLAVLPVAYNQFITFKDGKLGVNFFGFAAEAGLGGLLTGDAAHGGLSASARTPFGQKAAAGLGGTVDDQGRPRGGGFAAATAGAGLGASAALGGSLDESGGRGGVGSEAHGAGYQAKKVEITQFPQQLTIPENVKAIEFGPINPRVSAEEDSQSQRRRLKAKYAQLQRDEQNKIPNLDSRFNDNDDYVPPPPPPQQDYRSFFDFGYFSDLAATISGAPNPQTQSGYSIQIRKQKTPNTVELEKIITPDLSKKTDPTKKIDEFF
ncbi:uncharacterized protein [Chironomus tepperi]|uniref:uncharacterized protein isoform X2 n=1 Tax=Chironomus tepperi TaxID=113505 RepID=UPI00391F42B4